MPLKRYVPAHSPLPWHSRDLGIYDALGRKVAHWGWGRAVGSSMRLDPTTGTANQRVLALAPQLAVDLWEFINTPEDDRTTDRYFELRARYREVFKCVKEEPQEEPQEEEKN